jgi:WD40 repeat protein
MKHYLEHTEGNSSKFWQIELDGQFLNIRYGKIGTDGRMLQKDLKTPEKALLAFKKERLKKKKKGYIDPKHPLLNLPLQATALNDTVFKHDTEVQALHYLSSKMLLISADSRALYLWTKEGVQLDKLVCSADNFFFGKYIIKEIPNSERLLVLRSDLGITDDIFYILDYGQFTLNVVQQHQLLLEGGSYHRALDVDEQYIYYGFSGGFQLLDHQFQTVKTLHSPQQADRNNGTFVSAAGQRVIFVQYGGGQNAEDTVLVVDLEGQEQAAFQASIHHSTYGMMARFDQTGQRLYTTRSFNYETKVQVWELEKGTVVQELANYSSSGEVLDFTPSKDDQWLLVAVTGIDLILWHVQEERVVWVKHNQALSGHVAFADEQDYYQSMGNRIQKMDFRTGSSTQTVKGLSDTCRRLYFDAVQQRLWALSGKEAQCFNSNGSWHRTLEITDFLAGQLRHKMLIKRRFGIYGGSYAWYDFVTEEETPILSDQFNSIDYNEKHLLTTTGYFSDKKKGVRLWSHAGNEVQVMKPSRNTQATLWTKERFITTEGKKLEVWEIGAHKAALSIKKAHLIEGITVVTSHPEWLLTYAHNEIKLWDGQADKAAFFDLVASSIVAALPAGSDFVVLTEEGGLYYLNTQDLQLIQKAQLSKGITQATLAPKGQLYVATTSTELLLVDVSAIVTDVTLAVSTAPVPIDWTILEQPAEEETLLSWMQDLDWQQLKPVYFLALRTRLEELERQNGQVGAAHTYFTKQLLEAGAGLCHEFAHEEANGSYALSPDGAYLAVGTWIGENYEEDGTVQIWELSTGRCVNLLKENYGGIGWPDYYQMLQWSPDSRYLGAVLHTNCVAKLPAFSASSTPLAEACITNGWSRPPAWTWLGDQDAFAISCWHHSEIPLGITDNKKLHSYEDDTTWMQLNLSPAIQTALTREDLQPYEWCRSTPDGTLVFGYNTHKQAFAIDTNSKQVVWLKSVVPPMAFSAAAGYLVYLENGALCFADLKTGTLQKKCTLQQQVSGIYFTPDGQQFSVYGGKTVAIFQQQQLRVTLILEKALLESYSSSSELKPVQISPAGDRVALLLSDETLQIWELATHQLLHAFTAEGARGIYWGNSLVTVGPQQVAFYHADGRLINSCRKDLQVSAYNELYDQARPLAIKNKDLATRYECNPYYPFYKNAQKEWLVATPTGVVISATATATELDEHLSYSYRHQHAWPYRWGGGAHFYQTINAAKDDPKMGFNEREKAGFKPSKKSRKKKKAGISFEKGGSVLDLIQVYEQALSNLNSGWDYHITEYNGLVARKLVALGKDESAVATASKGKEWYKRVANLGWVAADLARKASVKLAELAFEEGVKALEEGTAEDRAGWAATFVYAPLAAAAYLLGKTALSEHYFEAAQQKLSEASNAYEKYASLASAYALCGDLEEALQTMKSGSETDRFTSYHSNFLHLLFQLGHHQAALNYARNWVEQGGTIDEFELLREGVHRLAEQRRYQEAQEWMALFDGLSWEEAYDSLIQHYAAHGAIELATDYLLEEISQYTSEGNFRVECLVRLASINPAAAQEQLILLNKAAVKPYYPEDYYTQLGKLYAQLGWLKEATKVLTAIQETAYKIAFVLGTLDHATPSATKQQRYLLSKILPLLSEGNFRTDKALRWYAELATKAALLEHKSAALLKEQTRQLADRNKEDAHALVRALVDFYVPNGWLEEAYTLFKKLTPSNRRYHMRSFAQAVAQQGYFKTAAALLRTLPDKDLNDRPNAAIELIQAL